MSQTQENQILNHLKQHKFITSFLTSSSILLLSPGFSDKPFNGKVVKFFTFERVKYEYFVSNGIKEGLYRSYFEGGNIQQEGYYRDGLKDGSWKKIVDFTNFFNLKKP